MPRYANPVATGTEMGNALETFVTSLYGGGPAREEREAKVADRRAQTALREAQLAKLQAERDAAAQAKVEQANRPLSIAEAFFPGAGADVMKFRDSGGMQDVPARDDEGFDLPEGSGTRNIPMDRPRGYTPPEEDAFNRITRGLAVAGNLPGKTTYDQLAKGQGQFQEQDIIRQALEGVLSADQQAALAGARSKPVFHEGAGGGTVNLFTGKQDQTSPIALSTAGQRNAAAGASNAAAGLSRGRTDLLGGMAEVEDPDSPGTFFKVPETQVGASILKTAAGPKPSPGYRPRADGGDGLEPIPGGPADQKITGAFNQDTAALSSSSANLDRLENAANAVMNHPGLKGITGLTGAIPNIPGSKAANAEAKLNTLKSQVAFGVLQDMRNNSKTGGALGNVSDAEGKRLEANLDALDKAQSTEEMQKSLRTIMQFAREAKERLKGAYNMKHQSRTTAASAAAPALRVGGAPAEPTATGPNGEKIIFRNGQWQPLQ